MRREAAGSDPSALLEHAFTGGVVVDPWRRGEARPIALVEPRLSVHVSHCEAVTTGHLDWDPGADRHAA